ncbi:MRG-domain-containing protein [Sporodiniella umbellata]|nr:MRG-domain-containing protein [Sporodiniella umbellata]
MESTDSTPNKEAFVFEENERVLCFQGPIVYDAKVLKRKWIEDEDENLYYYVHYQGWKNTWDEWVPETRILKHNEANLKTQQQLREFCRLKPKGKSQNTYTQEGLDRKRRDIKLEKEEDYLRSPEIKLEIPEGLKGYLVSDCENVTKNSKLVTLPKAITVNNILERFVAQKQKASGGRELNKDHLEQVCNGLRAYFNQSLGTLLLYRFERPQFDSITKLYPETELVDIYGAEHLLRLMVQLPSLVAYTTMDTYSIRILVDHATDLLRFIQRQQKQFFQVNYDSAPLDYNPPLLSTQK